MAKAWSWWLDVAARVYRSPRKEEGKASSKQGALCGDPGPSTAPESKITNRKTPWPLEVKGRLEDLSGHGLGAMGSS